MEKKIRAFNKLTFFFSLCVFDMREAQIETIEKKRKREKEKSRFSWSLDFNNYNYNKANDYKAKFIVCFIYCSTN